MYNPRFLPTAHAEVAPSRSISLMSPAKPKKMTEKDQNQSRVSGRCSSPNFIGCFDGQARRRDKIRLDTKIQREPLSR